MTAAREPTTEMVEAVARVIFLADYHEADHALFPSLVLAHPAAWRKAVKAAPAALALLPPAEGWREIASAPHATDVLLFSPPAPFDKAGRMEVGWASGGTRTGVSSSVWQHGHATHWQPLPPPPGQPEKEDR